VAKWVLAETGKLLLPKGTPRESLIDKNPAELDASALEVTPLENFGTHGPDRPCGQPRKNGGLRLRAVSKDLSA